VNQINDGKWVLLSVLEFNYDSTGAIFRRKGRPPLSANFRVVKAWTPNTVESENFIFCYKLIFRPVVKKEVGYLSKNPLGGRAG
jgi:hypothetical protein